MSALVRGLIGVAFLAASAVAHAEPPASNTPASNTPASNTPESNQRPAASAPLRVYMRSDGPLTFSARERSSRVEPTWCVAPCNASFVPGRYQLRLNGVAASDMLTLSEPGTLHGELHSREASRSAAWLGLNVGGIVGGVFITVGALGGPSWAYIAGGGSLLVGAVTFVVTYRADTASVTFTPGEPADVRGMPEPRAGNAAPAWLDSAERVRVATSARGLGFRVAF